MFKRVYSSKNKNVDSKFTQYRKNLKILYCALKEYKRSDLRKHKNRSTMFLFLGLLSLFILPKISFIPSIFLYLFSIVEFSISLYYTVFVTIKEIKFIWNYPLDCNPEGPVRSTIIGYALTKPIFKYTAGFCGSIMGINYFLQDFRGVNVIEEIGRNYVDGGKTGKETASIVWNKLKDGYGEKD